jgi:hypothetical protein
MLTDILIEERDEDWLSKIKKPVQDTLEKIDVIMNSKDRQEKLSLLVAPR